MKISAVWRKRIYTTTVAVFAAMVAYGIVAPEQLEQFNSAVMTIGAVIATLTNLLASSNVNKDE